MNDHVGKPFDLNHLVFILLKFSGYRAAENSPDDAKSDGTMAPSPSTLNGTGIDVDGALARMSGMRTLYTRLVGDFVKALDGAAPEFERLLCIPSLIEAGRHAHTLKGTASTLGATQLAKFASELETLCKSETDCDVLLKHSPALAELVRSTQASLRQVLEVLQPSSAPPATTTKSSPSFVSADDLEAARIAVDEITALLKNSDLFALQRLAELREVLAAVEPNHLESLEDAMQGLDFEAAQKVCQEIAELLGPTVSKE
jgi:HPt (histidine-containing phosphotransfer) domain-containing protein